MSAKKEKPLYAAGLFGFYEKKLPDPRYASFHRRMFAATIDSVLAMLILAPLIDGFLSWHSPLPPLDWSAVRAQITPDMSEQQVNRLMSSYLISSGYARQWFGNFITQLLVLAIVTGLCWRLFGATPGKWLLRMRVVDARTESLLSDWQVIIRLFGYVISTLILCIGFFWIGFDKRAQGWHDKLARSVVLVVPKAAKPAEQAAAESGSPAPLKEE